MTKLKTKWSNKDCKKVAEILRIEVPRGFGDTYTRFSNANVDEIIHLIDLGYADPEDAQNESPNLGEMIEFMKDHPEIRAGGYVIFPPRDDMRVTVELLVYNGKINKSLKSALKEFTKNADELQLDNKYFRAWW